MNQKKIRSIYGSRINEMGIVMKQLITYFQVQRPKDGENDNKEIFYMHHEMNQLKSELKFTLHRCCQLSDRN